MSGSRVCLVMAKVCAIVTVIICAAQAFSGKPVELGSSAFAAVFLMLASIRERQDEGDLL